MNEIRGEIIVEAIILNASFESFGGKLKYIASFGFVSLTPIIPELCGIFGEHVGLLSDCGICFIIKNPFNPIAHLSK